MSGILVSFVLRTSRNMLVTVVVVGAVLFGTLAMHSISASSEATTSTSTIGAGFIAPEVGSTASSAHDMSSLSAATADGNTAVATPTALVSPEATCTTTCTTDWLMAGMVCATAILVVVLAMLLLYPATRRVLMDILPRSARRVFFEMRLLEPPSLLALSISRT